MIWASSKCWVARRASRICSRKNLLKPSLIISTTAFIILDMEEEEGKMHGKSQPDSLQKMCEIIIWPLFGKIRQVICGGNFTAGLRTQTTFAVITNHRMIQSNKRPVWIGLLTGKLKGTSYKTFLSLSISVIEVSLCKTWLPAPGRLFGGSPLTSLWSMTVNFPVGGVEEEGGVSWVRMWETSS